MAVVAVARDFECTIPTWDSPPPQVLLALFDQELYSPSASEALAEDPDHITNLALQLHREVPNPPLISSC